MQGEEGFMIFPTQKEVKAILRDVREETHLTKWFRFEVQDNSFRFLPGQWLDLKPDDSFPWGGYSMMSSPLDLPFFELGLRKGKSHPTTGWLFEKAKKGDSVIIHGPGGRTVYDPELHQEAVLIMGGIGVTPLLSMARTLYENKSLKNNKITIFNSVKSNEEWSFRNLFSRLETDERIVVNTIFSHKEGHLTWNNLDVPFKDPHYFLCGPPSMIEELSQGLLEGKCVPRDHVHFEKWW